MKLVGCIGIIFMVVAFLLTVLFVGFKIGGVGDVASWEWYQVLMPAELYGLWVIFWVIVGAVGAVAENHTSRRLRDPHHTFELLRRFRAWRWEKSQKKYNPEES
jgi:hypothetical protein